MSKNYELKATEGKARAGVLKTRRGEIQTPVFMPVATRGAMKAAVDFPDLESTGAQICLANTYHLFLRPGEERVKNFGGLHKWMGWEKPILTDSGGFQVFSIKSKKITDEGVWFNSHIDGERFYLDAEKSIQIQHDLGADIIMAFDECPPSALAPTNLELKQTDPDLWKKKQEKRLYFKVRKAVERTHDWAKRSLDHHQKNYPASSSPTERPQLFGIVQGGCFQSLREQSLAEITNLPFDGFALGGLAVGEPPEVMYEVLDGIAHKLPTDKPRYLMGVGTPQDLLEAVERGIDMFDCVYPARNARHGSAYTWEGIIKITNAEFRDDKTVLDKNCSCIACSKGLTKGYLHHLMRVGEDLGKRYLTIHNLQFYQDLMNTAREKIILGEFSEWKKGVLKQLRSD